MNIGLRYDLPTLYVNSKGDMVNWYQNLNALVILLTRSNAGAYPGLPIVNGQSIGLNSGNYLNNDLKQVAPRFGLAYRPLSSNRLVLRGGYGIYYDPMSRTSRPVGSPEFVIPARIPRVVRNNGQT